MKHENNVRKGKVIRVVNGNTLDIEVELGFNIKAVIRVDLARLAVAEQFTDLGEKAKLDMNVHFHNVPDVTLQFDRHPKDRSRWIAEVWDDLGANLSDKLMQNNSGKLDETMGLSLIS